MTAHISSFPTFTIVVKGNPTSEYYYDKIQPVWRSIGVDPKRFDAITPSTLPESPLKFGNSMLEKYLAATNGRGKTITPTERAIWYSHFTLWQKCADIGEPILILEHDCVPFDNSKLFHNAMIDFHRFDMGALGCYVIEPDFASALVQYVKTHVICSGPLGTVCEFWAYEKKNGRYWHVVDPATIADFYDPGCTQIHHNFHKTTVQHYENTEVDGVVNRPWPYYVDIDLLEGPLTIDVIKKHRKPFTNERKKL
jgi:hypothetical protein